MGGDHRQDEQFVPEDVTAVPLAVQAAGGDAGVDLRRVRRERLQQVEEVQVEHQLRVRVGVQTHTEPLPQQLPRRLMPGQQPGDALRGVVELVQSGEGRGGDGTVPGGNRGHGLVDADRLTVADGYVQAVRVAAVGVGIHPPGDRTGHTADDGARGGRDGDAAGTGHRLDEEDVGVDVPARDVAEVPVGESAVLGDVGVGHRRVDAGTDAQDSAPPDRLNGGFQGRLVRPVHGHQPPLRDLQATPRVIPQPGPPGQQPAAQVELPAIPSGVQSTVGPPRPVVDPQVQRQPVEDVDQVLVLDPATLHEAREPVADPRQATARVMDPSAVRSGTAPRVPRYPFPSVVSASRCPSCAGWKPS